MKKIAQPKKRKKASAAKKTGFQFFLRHPLVIPVTVFMTLFFLGLVAIVLLGASTQGAQDTRIVNIFADGEQQTVTTRAKTVGDLLSRLEIELGEADIVEPQTASQIIEDDTQVNIYRARPVQIVDGDRILTQLTAQRAPRLVAESAGLALEDEDEVTFERIETNPLKSSVSEQLLVKRSVEIQLSIYGAVKTLRTTAGTVGEVIEAEGIRPEDDDTMQPSIDSRITDGTLVALNRPGVTTIAVTEPVEFNSEVVDDSDVQAGRTQVRTAGVLGERAVIYEVVNDGDIEVSRTEIQTVVVREPVTEVIARGTKIVTPTFNPTVTVAGDKAALMSAAGIAESDYAFVDFIVSKESGWRPGAVNSSSGAYGLCQSLPASKMASAGADYLTNPVTQLRWCSSYASGRYGGWSNAYNAWLAQNWW